jgi:hypothetical protein
LPSLARLFENAAGFKIRRGGPIDDLSRQSIAESDQIADPPVARDPSHLFDKQHLSEDHSERLIDGWWYGTNNSASQTRAWLQRACSCAGLKWGDDFKTSLTPTIIF